MSDRQANIRQDFIRFLKSRAWTEAELQASPRIGDDFYVDAQFAKDSSNRSLVSLIQAHDQILFEAEFDDFVLRVSTSDCDVAHSEALIDALPQLNSAEDVLRLLDGLLTQGVAYTLGIGDGFEPLSADTVGRFAEAVL